LKKTFSTIGYFSGFKKATKVSGTAKTFVLIPSKEQILHKLLLFGTSTRKKQKKQ